MKATKAKLAVAALMDAAVQRYGSKKDVERAVEDALSEGRCAALRKNGLVCPAYPEPGHTRCGVHGGPMPPQYNRKAKKIRRALPPSMRAAYMASLLDPDILTLRAEIALADARIHLLVQQTNSGESLRKVGTALSLADEIHRRLDAMPETPVEVLKLVDSLVDCLMARKNHEDEWREVEHASESRRKLVDTERKLVEAHAAAVDADRLRMVLMFIVDAIVRIVGPLEGGRKAVAELSKEIMSLVNPPAGALKEG